MNPVLILAAIVLFLFAFMVVVATDAPVWFGLVAVLAGWWCLWMAWQVDSRKGKR